MHLIDLEPDQVGCMCLLCECTGQQAVAQLLDRDLGPLCHDCFAEALKATVELRFQGLMCPSEK